MYPKPRFEDCFWATTDATDYATGVKTVHSRVQQGKVELCYEMIGFCKERIAAEETFASVLAGISRKPLRPDGFGKSKIADNEDHLSNGLLQAFAALRGECAELGVGHRQTAQRMRETILQPLEEFAKMYTQAEFEIKKVKNSLANYQKQIEELNRMRHAYMARSVEADTAEEEALEKAEKGNTSPTGLIPKEQSPNLSSSGTTRLASMFSGVTRVASSSTAHSIALSDETYTITKLSSIATRMQREIPCHDVAPYPLLGTYHNAITGADICDWLKCEENKDKRRREDDIKAIAQGMLDHGYLRHIGPGNRFVPTNTSFYQFKKPGSASDTEPFHKITRKEAEKADFLYRSAVEKVDMTRTALIIELTEHLKQMQALEHGRLNVSKSAFCAFYAAQSDLIPILKEARACTMTYLEVFDPARDIDLFVQQHRTGYARPRPLLYHNFYHGATRDQIFGVSLEEHTKICGRNVPQLVEKCISAINKEGTLDVKRNAWLAFDTSSFAAYSLRAQLDHPPNKKITLKTLRTYPLPVLAAVCLLYLKELPDCLCTSEICETVKVLYLSHPDEKEQKAKIASLRNLIATIPTPHFLTLDALFAHFISLKPPVDDGSNGVEYFTALGYTIGPIILRPNPETVTSLHDRHPQRMVRDLLTYYDQIFGPLRTRSAAIRCDSSLDKKMIEQEEVERKDRQRQFSVEQQDVIASGASEVRPKPDLQDILFDIEAMGTDSEEDVDFLDSATRTTTPGQQHARETRDRASNVFKDDVLALSDYPLLTREEFNRCADAFLENVTSLSERHWRYATTTRSGTDLAGTEPGYLVKGPVRRRINKNTLSTDRIISFDDVSEDPLTDDLGVKEYSDPSSLGQNAESDWAFLEHHIVYDPSYKVPALYVSASRPDGSQVQLNELLSEAPQDMQHALRGQGFGGALTLADHPHLNVPNYHLHPCETATLMSSVGRTARMDEKGRGVDEHGKIIVHDGNYISIWLSFVGPAVGLQIQRLGGKEPVQNEKAVQRDEKQSEREGKLDEFFDDD